MTNKLKQRRLRRLHDDVAWWKAEAHDWKQIAFEHADKLTDMQHQLLSNQKGN